MNFREHTDLSDNIVIFPKILVMQEYKRLNFNNFKILVFMIFLYETKTLYVRLLISFEIKKLLIVIILNYSNF